MSGAVRLDLSGFPVRVRTGDRAIVEGFERYAPEFLVEDGGAWLLDGDVGVEGDPVDAAALTKTLHTEMRSGRARFGIDVGSIEVDAEGRFEARLAPTERGGQRFFGLVNLLVAALAWILPRHEAAVLHGAAAVVGERAFVLIGPEGSGKTTWASHAARGGATVLSDDVVFARLDTPEPRAFATPFRRYEDTPLRPASWPIGAFLHPAHGPVPRLDAVHELEAGARVLANLPYVASVVARDPWVARALDRIVATAPHRKLTFAKDPSFLELLRGFERTRPAGGSS